MNMKGGKVAVSIMKIYKYSCYIMLGIFMLSAVNAQSQTPLMSFRGDTGENLGYFDSLGNLVMKKGLVTNGGYALTADGAVDEVIFRDSNIPAQVIGLVKLEGALAGQMKIKGYMCYENSTPLASHPFYIKNDGGAVVASMDSYGVLYLDGYMAPSAPTSLAYFSSTTYSTTLQWTDNSTNETGFLFQKSLSPDGPFTTVSTIAGTAYTGTKYATDNEVYAGTAYYRVVAYRTVGGTTVYSLNSNVYTYTVAAPTVTIAVSSSGSESVGTKDVTIYLSRASYYPIEVPISLSGSASLGNGLDYTINENDFVVTISAYQTSGYVRLSINNDTIGEFDETVEIALGTPTNAVLGAARTSTYTILDDDTIPSSVQNPNFDLGSAGKPTGWDTSHSSNDVAFTWDNTVSWTGAYSLKINGSDDGEASWNQIHTINPSKNYYFESWVKTLSATGNTGVEVAWYDSSKNEIQPPTAINAMNNLTGDCDWTLIGMSLDPPATAYYAEIRLYSGENEGEAWFDNIRLIENLVANPSFEDVTLVESSYMPDQWSYSTEPRTNDPENDPEVVDFEKRADSTFANAGAYSAEISDMNDASGCYWASGEIPVVGGYHYNLESWTMMKQFQDLDYHNLGSSKIKIKWFDISHAYISEEVTMAYAYSWDFWNKLSIAGNAPATAYYARIYLYFGGAGWWFDDVDEYGQTHWKDYGRAEAVGRFDDVRLTSVTIQTIDHFEVTTASDRATKNCPIVVTVRALDANGDLVTNYEGDIDFTTSLGGNVIYDSQISSGSYHFTAADGGEKSFDITPTQNTATFYVTASEDGTSRSARSRNVKVTDPIGTLPALSVSGTDIVDVNGIVELTGYNIAGNLNGSKLELTSINPSLQMYGLQFTVGPEDFKRIHDQGFNCVRLTLRWDQIWPWDEIFLDLPTGTTAMTENDYLREGLATIDNMINWAEEAGVYVILDFESWTRYHKDEPIFNDASDETVPFFINFINQLQADYPMTWKAIAKRYANRGAVLAGYDMFGEPHMAKCSVINNDYVCEYRDYNTGDPTETQWNSAGYNNYVDLLEDAITNVRNLDTTKLTIVESAFFEDQPSWFPSVPQDTPNLVYSNHWYIGFFGLEGNEEGNEDEFATGGAHASIYAATQNLNAPFYAGELGMAPGFESEELDSDIWVTPFMDNYEHRGYLGNLYEVIRHLNKNGWSWTYWTFMSNCKYDPGQGHGGWMDLFYDEGKDSSAPDSGIAEVYVDGQPPLTYYYDRRDCIDMMREYSSKAYMFKAHNDISLIGNAAVSAGSHTYPYTYTDMNNNVYEVLTEVLSPTISKLDHKWEFSVPANCDNVSFYLDAYHSTNAIGQVDDFKFSYATTLNGTYYDLLTVSRTSSDDTYQIANIPVSGGTIFIRARDTNQSSGTFLDSLSIDHMFILGRKVGNGGKPSLQLVLPQTGFDWGINTAKQINWLAKLADTGTSFQIKLIPYDGSDPITLATRTIGDTNYYESITMPSSVDPSTYTLRVESQNYPTTYFDEFPEPIIVKNIAVITRGGVEWDTGESYKVVWSGDSSSYDASNYTVDLIDVYGFSHAVVNDSGGKTNNIYHKDIDLYDPSQQVDIDEGLYKIRVTKGSDSDMSDRFVYIK